jgi:hypothetical protein
VDIPVGVGASEVWERGIAIRYEDALEVAGAPVGFGARCGVRNGL